MNTGTRGLPKNISSQDENNLVRPPQIINQGGIFQAVQNESYLITTSTAVNIRLPFYAKNGDVISFCNMSNNLTSHVVLRNGHRILGDELNLLLDANKRIIMQYLNNQVGWIVF